MNDSNNKKTKFRTRVHWTKRVKLDTPGMRYCSKCEEILPVSEFGKHKGLKDGLQYVCKKCMSRSTKINYEKRKIKAHKKDKAENKNYMKYIEKFKTTKINEIKTGLICSECGVYFQRAHGTQVICASCFHHLKAKKSRKMSHYKISWIPEIELENMYADRKEVARMNGVNRIKMYE